MRRWRVRVLGWIVGIAVWAAAGTAAAQSTDEPFYDHERGGAAVLFEEADMGGFGGPTFTFSSVAGEPGMLLGGRGGVLIDHVFAIGGAGYGLINSPTPGTRVGQNVAGLGLGYGGVFFEGVLFPDSVVHPTAGALFAGGGASYEFTSRDQSDISTSIFVIDTQASAEVNLTTYARVLVGINYRAVFGVDLPNLSNDDLSGPGAHVTLKFGVF